MYLASLRNRRSARTRDAREREQTLLTHVTDFARARRSASLAPGLIEPASTMQASILQMFSSFFDGLLLPRWYFIMPCLQVEPNT